MKGKAIIGIAMIVALLASAVGVVSAADAQSTVEFEDQGYTVRITFPNGEGIAYNGSKNMSLEYHDSLKNNVNLINVRGWDAYTPINISIKIEGISDKDWSLSRWNSFSWPFYKPVYADERTKRFEVQCADHRYGHLTQCRVYKIKFNKLYCNIYFTLVLQGEDCNTYCKNRLGHGIWDGESEYPNCACICEKGWEMTKDVLCVACDDICKEKGEHYIYDPENSYKNACVCKCEDGYEHSYYTDKCEKVECPPNSTNVADLAGSCPKDRKLNRHCCCNESYIRSWGTCVREDSGEEDYYIKPVVHEIIAGEKIEFSLVKIKHGRDTTVSNDNVGWVVANETSINPNIDKNNANIGTIKQLIPMVCLSQRISGHVLFVLKLMERPRVNLKLL